MTTSARYLQNRAHILEQKRLYYAKNRERIIKYQMAWNTANRDKTKKYIAAWRRRNPEKSNAVTRRREACKHGSEGTHTAEQIIELLKRQKYRCANAACRKSIRKRRHVDHRIALSRGGSNDIRNIQLLCPFCNRSKSDRFEAEWARENGLLL